MTSQHKISLLEKLGRGSIFFEWVIKEYFNFCVFSSSNIVIDVPFFDIPSILYSIKERRGTPQLKTLHKQHIYWKISDKGS